MVAARNNTTPIPRKTCTTKMITFMSLSDFLFVRKNLLKGYIDFKMNKSELELNR